MQVYANQKCCEGRGPFFLLLGTLGALLVISFVYSHPASGLELSLASDPPGASAFINGRLAGPTPLTVSGMKPGRYSVRLEKEGYTPTVKTIELGSGGTQLSEALVKVGTGGLIVDIAPSGAEVLLNGELQGYTPLTLPAVPAGSYELVVRKTNFKSYVQYVEIESGKTSQFRQIQLDDKILAMLQGTIAQEPQRVANYMDLGHYLFVNDRIDEAAEQYAKALAVAATPMSYPKDMSQEEQRLEMRLRAEDLNRLHEEIRKKSHWRGKDVSRFREVLARQQERSANSNIGEWAWVTEQVRNLENDQHFDAAVALLSKHIAASRDGSTLPQAYIQLMSLRLRMRNLKDMRDTYQKFSETYGGRPELTRQAANAIYSTQGLYLGDERIEVLTMSEQLLRKGIAATTSRDPMSRELNALCKFELGNVLCYEGHPELAREPYQESIDGTQDQGTKELRGLRLVDALKAVKDFPAAHALVDKLMKSKQEQVSSQARLFLVQIQAMEQQK